MNFLLLGNGFDLHHGLATSYIDMIRIFRHLTENSDVTYKNVGEILDSYKSSTSDDNNNRLLDYCQTYDEALKNINWTSDFSWAKLAQNRWYQYFCYTNDKDLTWIDFELEIKHALECIEQEYSCEKHKDNNDGGNAVVKFLIPSEKLSKENLVSLLYEELCVFKQAMCEYLHYFVDEMLPSLKESDVIDDVIDFVKDAHYIITMNYTSTFEKLYFPNKRYDFQQLVHYHGQVADGKRIVVGVNSNDADEYHNGKKPDTTYICFKKYFQRILYNFDRNYLKLIQKQNYINEKYKNDPIYIPSNKTNVLSVIGHSLNESDADLIRDLFSSCCKYNVYYHDFQALGGYIRNLTKIFGKQEFENMRRNGILEFIPLEKTTPKP